MAPVGKGTIHKEEWGGLNTMEWQTGGALFLNIFANLFFGVWLAFGWSSDLLFGAKDTKISQSFNFVSATWFLGAAVFCAMPLFPSFKMRQGVVARVLQAQLAGNIWNLAALCFTGAGPVKVNTYRILFFMLAVLITVNLVASDRITPVRATHTISVRPQDWKGSRLFLSGVIWAMIFAQIFYMLQALQLLHRNPIYVWTGKSGKDVLEVDHLAKGIHTLGIFQHIANNYNVFTHFESNLVKNYLTLSSVQSIIMAVVLVLTNPLKPSELTKALSTLIVMAILKAVGGMGVHERFVAEPVQPEHMSPPVSPRAAPKSPRGRPATPKSPRGSQSRKAKSQ